MLIARPMGFPLDLAVRYMRSKKRSAISLGTLFAVLGVALGVAGLATTVSVTGGFRKQFRDKVLGVNAHVLVLKRSSYFGEYRDVIDQVKDDPEIVGIAPFTINPMMVTKGHRTATGVMLKGVVPEMVNDVLDLPKQLISGSLDGLRLPGETAPAPKPQRAAPGLLPPIIGSAAQAQKTKEGLSDDALDFLDQIEGEILDEEEPESVAEFLAKLAQAEPAEEKETSFEDSLPPGAPIGAIEPEEGYSELPEDALPDELIGDPCETAGILPGIVIGKTLSANLDAQLHDCVQVTSPLIGFSFSQDSIRAPVAKQFRVIGVFDAGFDQYDAKFVYTDLYEAQKFQDSGDSVTGIEMTIRNVDDAPKVAARLGKKLKSGLLYTLDWQELNKGLFTALKIQQIMMSLVLALITVVAAFTVIATLIMVVLEKKKEIAVMKAMGASDSAILRAFLYQGAIIGMGGSGLGLLGALFVCQALLKYAIPLDAKVYFISRIPVDVNLIDFALIGSFGVAVCLVATLWPAYHAARLRPADGFRDQ